MVVFNGNFAELLWLFYIRIDDPFDYNNDDDEEEEEVEEERVADTFDLNLKIIGTM